MRNQLALTKYPQDYILRLATKYPNKSVFELYTLAETKLELLFLELEDFKKYLAKSKKANSVTKITTNILSILGGIYQYIKPNYTIEDLSLEFLLTDCIPSIIEQLKTYTNKYNLIDFYSSLMLLIEYKLKLKQPEIMNNNLYRTLRNLRYNLYTQKK